MKTDKKELNTKASTTIIFVITTILVAIKSISQNEPILIALNIELKQAMSVRLKPYQNLN